MIALRLSDPLLEKEGGRGMKGREKCFTEKVGTRQRLDIQRAGSGPAPISENLKHL